MNKYQVTCINRFASRFVTGLIPIDRRLVTFSGRLLGMAYPCNPKLKVVKGKARFTVKNKTENLKASL